MTTAAEALTAIRSRLESGSITFPMRWQGEDAGDLPDDPTTFAFIEFENFGAGRGPAAFGNGAGGNLYRNEGLINAYVFSPNGEGMGAAMDNAEAIAARLRSFRDSSVSCFSAVVRPIGSGTSVEPPGLNSEVNNYTCAVAEIALHFDQIG
jgi:hypothetical protein